MGEGERLGLDEVGVMDFAAGVWREREDICVYTSLSSLPIPAQPPQAPSPPPPTVRTYIRHNGYTSFFPFPACV